MTNTCRHCGRKTGKGAYLCGMCSPLKLRATGQYAYRKVHVHEHADGSKTIEAGVRCECEGDVA